MSNLSKSTESMNEAYICELLKPLQQQESASIEYVCQYKAVVEFNKRLRLLEMLYADIYKKLAELDKEIQNNLS
jgi:hypothetical protein